jgi:hypothetical protein
MKTHAPYTNSDKFINKLIKIGKNKKAKKRFTKFRLTTKNSDSSFLPEIKIKRRDPFLYTQTMDSKTY